MMWNIALFTHVKKQSKWVSLFLYSTDSAGIHLPQSKHCRNVASPQLTTPQQHNVRIFIQLLLSIPPIHLAEEQFLKFSYLSHILHLVNTRYLLPLNKDVIKQHFSASEYIAVARDLMCCCTQLYSPGLLTLLPLQGEIFFANLLKDTYACNLMALPPLLIQ